MTPPLSIFINTKLPLTASKDALTSILKWHNQVGRHGVRRAPHYAAHGERSRDLSRSSFPRQTGTSCRPSGDCQRRRIADRDRHLPAQRAFPTFPRKPGDWPSDIQSDRNPVPMNESQHINIVRREDNLSEETIRQIYTPAKMYRISRHRYPPGTKFPAITREQVAHFLLGQCRITMGGQATVLSSGDVAELSSGHYELEVLGDSDLEYVSVWPIYKWLPQLKPE